jgi:hypothetical protein
LGKSFHELVPLSAKLAAKVRPLTLHHARSQSSDNHHKCDSQAFLHILTKFSVIVPDSPVFSKDQGVLEKTALKNGGFWQKN